MDDFLRKYEESERGGVLEAGLYLMEQFEAWRADGMPSDARGWMLFTKRRMLYAAALDWIARHDAEAAEYCLDGFDFLMERTAGGTIVHAAFTRGIVHYMKGDYAAAEKQLRLFIALYSANDKDELAWVWLGNALFRQNKWADTIDAYQKAIEIRPHFREAVINSAVVAMRLGDEAAAHAILRSIGADEEGEFTRDDIIDDVALSSYALPKSMDVYDVPIFINARDRVVCLERLVDWLVNAGYRRIYILDNDSTYEPLLQYYERLDKNDAVRVVRFDKNYGHTAIWDSGVLKALNVRTPYIYTDPDVLPVDDCPKDFVARLWRVLEKYPYLTKAGPGLLYSDITFDEAEQKKRWEAQWYECRPEDDVYFAAVDTTLALYRNIYHYHIDVAARTTGRIMMRHLPWYYRFDALPDDERYYIAHANGSSSIKKEHEKR